MRWAPTNQIIRAARDGDNWPLTWADDDALYTTCGDGTGFEPKVEQKLSLGFARVTGTPDTFAGVNARSKAEQFAQGRAGRKGWGLLCARPGESGPSASASLLSETISRVQTPASPHPFRADPPQGRGASEPFGSSEFFLRSRP